MNTIQMTKCNLASVQQLRKGVENTVHHGPYVVISLGKQKLTFGPELQKVINNHTFVGVVGPDRPESLIQHETKLFLLNHVHLAEELFYQLGLRQFGRIGQMVLQPAPNLDDLIAVAVSCEADAEEQTGLSAAVITQASVQTIADCGVSLLIMLQRISSTLKERREMLLEYFSLEISEDGFLKALPLLLPGYKPNLDRLPLCKIEIQLFFCYYMLTILLLVLLRAGLEVKRILFGGAPRHRSLTMCANR